MSNLSPPDPDPKLATLFALAQTDAQTWSKSELAAILRHQLRAPLEADLATVVSTQADADGGAADVSSRPAAELRLSADRGIRTFADLLSHPKPPLELVRLMKDYAKVARHDGSLPLEVATLLYYASLSLARLRCGQSITDLDDAALRSGLEWGVRRSWADDLVRSIFEEQLRELVV